MWEPTQHKGSKKPPSNRAGFPGTSLDQELTHSCESGGLCGNSRNLYKRHTDPILALHPALEEAPFSSVTLEPQEAVSTPHPWVLPLQGRETQAEVMVAQPPTPEAEDKRDCPLAPAGETAPAPGSWHLAPGIGFSASDNQL